MGSVFKVIEEYSADINAVQEFCDSIYADNFADNFSKKCNSDTSFDSSFFAGI